MKISLLYFFCLMTFHIASTQPVGIASEPGKCYAKCQQQDIYVIEYKLLPKYIGPSIDTLTNKNIVALQFTPQASETKWEKKKADKNCLSSDPNDCLVWCKVNIPEIKSVEYFVIDTSQKGTFEWQKFPIKKLVKKGGIIEWKEVVCEKDMTKSLIKEIQNELIKRGYYEGEVDGKISINLKQGLTSYQKKEGLYVGAITIESLKYLQIL
jgi:hypothetical protein